MKRVHTFGLCVFLLLHGYCYAQESPLPVFQSKADKPSLFSALPNRFEVSSDSLLNLVSAEIEAPIQSQLSGQFFITGKIVDKNHQNPGNFSVNIRLANYHNALFNLSVKLLADNSLAMQGRIIHPKYNDVLILYKEKDKYIFKKQLQKLFMPE